MVATQQRAIAPDGRTRGARRSRRDWVVDTVLFVVVGLASTLGLALSAAPLEGTGFRQPAEWELWLDGGVGVAVWLAMWWRRRWPVVLGVVTALAAVVSVFASGPALVLLLTVAIHRRWPWAVLVGATNLVAGFLFVLWWEDGSISPIGWVVVTGFGLAFTAAAVGFGLYIRARRLLLASLRERAERAEAEKKRAAESARQGERTRIAREMHDVLAHRISLVSMHAGALEYRTDASAQEVTTAAGVIRENAHLALVDLRQVIGVLRDEDGTGDDGTSTSRPQPTLATLDELVEETRAAGVVVRAEVDLGGQAPPVTTSRTVYRVLQEGLTNARKHGRGAAVDVCVRGRCGDGVTVEVRNALRPGGDVTPAPGTDAAPASGLGLIGLAERTRLVGGRWEHGVVDGAFRLLVWLPWPEEGAP